MKLKLKNIINGTIADPTLHGNEQLPEADVTRAKAQFLYSDAQELHFMDTATFDQFSITKKNVGLPAEFLVEGQAVDVILFQNLPVTVNVPVKVELKVAQTEPGVRGNSQNSGGTKSAELESGVKIQVPLFIKTGDMVKVNTEEGKYVERVK